MLLIKWLEPLAKPLPEPLPEPLAEPVPEPLTKTLPKTLTETFFVIYIMKHLWLCQMWNFLYSVCGHFVNLSVDIYVILSVEFWYSICEIFINSKCYPIRCN